MFGGVKRAGWKQKADGMNWTKSHTGNRLKGAIEGRTLKEQGETGIRHLGLKTKKLSKAR